MKIIREHGNICTELVISGRRVRVGWLLWRHGNPFLSFGRPNPRSIATQLRIGRFAVAVADKPRPSHGK